MATTKEMMALYFDYESAVSHRMTEAAELDRLQRLGETRVKMALDLEARRWTDYISAVPGGAGVDGVRWRSISPTGRSKDHTWMCNGSASVQEVCEDLYHLVRISGKRVSVLYRELLIEAELDSTADALVAQWMKNQKIISAGFSSEVIRQHNAN